MANNIYWPFENLLWHPCSSLLHTFLLDHLFYFLLIYRSSMNILAVSHLWVLFCGLPLYSPKSAFWWQKLLFYQSPICQSFPLLLVYFCVLLKKYFSAPKSKRYFLMLFSKHSIVFPFIFHSIIHLKLLF